MSCTHNRARRPARPIPDHTTRCPDCGEKVGFRAGRWITVREMNDQLEQNRREREAAPAEVERLRAALRRARGVMPHGPMVGVNRVTARACNHAVEIIDDALRPTPAETQPSHSEGGAS